MASRAKSAKPNRARRVKQPPASSTPWPTIESFFKSAEGNINLGCIDQIPGLQYTAVVSDDHNMLVALVRNPGETLRELLDRVDAALGPAVDDQVFVDEINAPSTPPEKSRRR